MSAVADTTVAASGWGAASVQTLVLLRVGGHEVRGGRGWCLSGNEGRGGCSGRGAGGANATGATSAAALVLALALALALALIALVIYKSRRVQ